MLLQDVLYRVGYNQLPLVEGDTAKTSRMTTAGPLHNLLGGYTNSAKSASLG